VKTFPTANNLDWLRLLFALQVCLHHLTLHFDVYLPKIIKNFPGVPAFFFVSGFLVYVSYQNAPGRQYARNRLLRIYPALIAVTLGGAAVTVVALGWETVARHAGTYALWITAQLTLGQAYNAPLFREVGVGVMNGSLWSITVELLFYACVPLVAAAERRYRHAIWIVGLMSFAVFAIGPLVSTEAVYRQKTAYDIVALTPLAWGWMFCVGILAAKHFDLIRPYLRFFPLAIVPMALMILFADGGLLFKPIGNRLGVIYFLCYAALILWAAFALPHVPLKTDLSYGAYVWHMPVVNLMLVLGFQSVAAGLLLTLLVAATSWYLVERPAIRLKKTSLREERPSRDGPARSS
jgi:peptidoglycan/LPS O-acetylase OafA/YrhL